MSKDNMKHRRLQELDESDFEIVDGQPDIRGWDVKTVDGTTIGEVDELILDARERKVRYMVVDLDDDELDLDDDRKVLIPIGTAQLHEKDDDVILEGITTEQLRQLPEYDKDNLTNETEYAISSVLGRTGTYSGDVMNADFYKHEHFNEGNLYQRRLPQSTGSTALSSGQWNYLQSRDEIGDTAEEGGNSSYDSSTGLGRERSFMEEEVNEDALSPVSNSRSTSGNLDDVDDDDEDQLRKDMERRNLRGGDESSRSGL
jgi:sporulation protein YlmC with PRC-barrel domain